MVSMMNMHSQADHPMKVTHTLGFDDDWESHCNLYLGQTLANHSKVLEDGQTHYS